MLLQRAVMLGPPEAFLKKKATASDCANRARLRLRQTRKFKIGQLDIGKLNVRELYLGELNFWQINLRELNLRKVNAPKINAREIKTGTLRAFFDRGGGVFCALNRQRIRQLAMVAQRVHLSGRREGIAVRNHLNTNPCRILLGGILFRERNRIRTRVQRQQSLHTMRYRLTKIRERLTMILVANTVNQQHRRIMVLTFAVQGTLRMCRSILSQPPLLTGRQRTTLQQMRHLRHASHLLASAHNAPANPLLNTHSTHIGAARCVSLGAKITPH